MDQLLNGCRLAFNFGNIFAAVNNSKVIAFVSFWLHIVIHHLTSNLLISYTPLVSSTAERTVSARVFIVSFHTILSNIILVFSQ